MTKKQRRKRFGPRAGHCLGCGRPLRRHEPACRRCGRRSALFQPKGLRVVKAAGGEVVPLRRPLCWNGHPAGRWDRYCARCGEPVGLSREQSAAMAGKALAGGWWGREAMREPDPGRRAVLEKAARAQPGWRGGDAAVIAAAMGYKSVEDGARRELNPMFRQIFERAWLGLDGGGDAA